MARSKAAHAALCRAGYSRPWVDRSLAYAAPPAPQRSPSRSVHLSLHAMQALLTPAARAWLRHKRCRHVTLLAALAWAPLGPAESFAIVRACSSILSLDVCSAVRA